MGAAFLLSAVIIAVVFGALHQKYLRPNFAEEFQAVIEELDPLLAGKSAEQAQRVIDQQQLNFRARVVALDQDGGLVGFRPAGADYRVVFESDEGRFATFQRQQGGSLLLALLMTAAVFGAAAFLITYPLVRRLRRQEQTIGRIAAGDLSARVEEKGKDALGLLGKRINLMADRITSLVDGQRHLLQAVSHEIRTPVARIGFGVEMIEAAETQEERHTRIAALHDDVDEMERLLDELMMFLRVDSGGTEIHKTPLEIATTINALIAKTQTLFPDVKFENKIPPKVDIQASANHLPRALENLIRNAARHATGLVKVVCSMDADAVNLEVHDDGKGIAPEDRTKIFDAFTRLDGARTRSKGDGAGLGLAICERVVRLHGGTISVGDSPLGGAVFAVRIPRS
ncbi:ATP-binding protein [Oceaniferula spumae]